MKVSKLFTKGWNPILASLRRGSNRLRWRSLVRQGRKTTAVGASLTVVFQAVLVVGGSAALAGCGSACLATTGPASTGTGDQLPGGVNAPVGTSANTAASKPTSHQVTLVTGDKLQVTGSAGAAQTVTPVVQGAGAAAKSSRGLVRLGIGGDEYVIPDEAVPYLGSVLDPRLFDASYLARAAVAGHGSAPPLTITYTGRSVPALPGIHVTHASDGTATATVVGSQGGDLGQLLASRWSAGQARLPGITKISLAQPSAGPALPAAPSVPLPASAAASKQGAPAYHTLTVQFTGLSSDATEVGVLQNVDDARLGTYVIEPASTAVQSSSGHLTGQQGPFSFSVPDGTYSLMFSVLTPNPAAAASGASTGVDAALVTQPQFTVSGNQTVTLDAGAAKPYQAQVAAVTPSARVDQMDVFRSSATGGSCGGGGQGFGQLRSDMGLYSVSGPGEVGTQLSAAPTTTTVTQGSFYFDADSALLTGPTSAPLSTPQYLLDFPYSGSVPASLSYTVPVTDLTTVNSQLYTDPLLGGSDRVVVTTWVLHPWGGIMPMTPSSVNGASCGSGLNLVCMSPGPRTDYRYSNNPKLSFWEETFSDAGANGTLFSTGANQPSSSPGQHITETWNKMPVVPSPASTNLDPANVISLVENSSSTIPIIPPLETATTATRQDDNGIFGVRYGTDATNEVDSPYSENSNSGCASFYRNGTLVSSGNNSPFGYYMPMQSQPATYQLDWGDPCSGNTTTSNSNGASQATNWTFRSAASDPLATLPATTQCLIDASKGCSFLPLLFLGYDLPLNYNGQATAGQPFNVTFSVGHQQYELPPTGVSATVSVSFDDGKTWSTPVAATSQGSDQFSTTIQQPSLASTSGFVSLKIHAQDAAGNAIDQTIIRAYGLTS